jgi:hypothetical protein
MGVKLNTQRKGVSITWEPGEFEGLVTITATGENGDVHTKVPVENTGEAGLFFPVDYTGKPSIEVRDPFDNVIDSGTIKA